MRVLLNRYTLKVLKKEISKNNIKNYSKLRKKELIDLIIKNKSKFTHLMKKEKYVEKKKPEIKKPEVKSKKEKIVVDTNYINKIIEENKLRIPIKYTSKRITLLSFLLNILKRHKNDCVTIDPDNLLSRFQYVFMTSRENATEEKKNKKIIDAVKECRKNKTMAVVPFLFDIIKKKSSHLNMLIYNYKRDEWEHYEPHGQKFRGKFSSSNLYKKLKKMLEKSITKNTKYIQPNQTCPRKLGLQSGYSKYTGEFYVENELIKDIGYCSAWSMFLADVRLSNPDLSPKEVYQEALNLRGEKTVKIMLKDPNMSKGIEPGRFFLQFIRDYSKIYLKEIKFFAEKYKLYLDDKTSKTTKKKIENEIENHLKKEFKKVSHVKNI